MPRVQRLPKLSTAGSDDRKVKLLPSGVQYNHETIQVDGEAFSDCEFRDARLVYSGGEPPSFIRCRFDGCEWKFDDAAARTLAHLKVLWAVGAKACVQDQIKAITGASR